MPTSRQLFLHDAVLGGVDTTLPAHLIGTDKWRTQHNMRVNPGIEQVPRKVKMIPVIGTGTEDVRWISSIPSVTSGYGKTVVLTQTAMHDVDGNTLVAGLHDDGTFRQWATAIYAGELYYTNELNQLRKSDGTRDSLVAPVSGRYLTFWYDHAVIGWPVVNGVTYPNRIWISGLHDFSDFDPRRSRNANEADYYDFVEWQELDYPFTGVTGIARRGVQLIVYTPTAIIPLVYVGLPKVFRINEPGLLIEGGNTFPWTLVELGNVHFFYDAEDSMFLAYEGQMKEIGEPVRQFMRDNLNTNITLASQMYGFVDGYNREVWWPFISKNSTKEFDLAVVFNYKYERWFTASVEDVRCFCPGVRKLGSIGELSDETGHPTIGELEGPIGFLGIDPAAGPSPRLFGSSDGQLLREEMTSDASNTLLSADEPVLESADFHYGDLRTTKENDAIVVNAVWDDHPADSPAIEVRVKGRDYLSTPIDWTLAPTLAGLWVPELPDGELNYPVHYGRVLRYRFTGKNVRGLKFSAFSDRVRVAMPEK